MNRKPSVEPSEDDIVTSSVQRKDVLGVATQMSIVGDKTRNQKIVGILCNLFSLAAS